MAQKFQNLGPKNISHSKSPDIEWVTWIMKILNQDNNYDIFSILRPTSPLRSVTMIKMLGINF